MTQFARDLNLKSKVYAWYCACASQWQMYSKERAVSLEQAV